MATHQVRNPPLVALPNQNRKTIQAQIDGELYAAAKKEAMSKMGSISLALEWGLKEFLAHANPQAAADLGIILKPKA